MGSGLEWDTKEQRLPLKNRGMGSDEKFSLCKSKCITKYPYQFDALYDNFVALQLVGSVRSQNFGNPVQIQWQHMSLAFFFSKSTKRIFQVHEACHSPHTSASMVQPGFFLWPCTTRREGSIIRHLGNEWNMEYENGT